MQSLHSLYRESGDWYHVLRQFPGALLDQDGYLLFATQEEFRNCPGLKVFDEFNTVTVITKICDIPGYTRFVPDIYTDYTEEPLQPSNVTPMTEGSRITVMVNAYERNRRARALCIKKYGLNCSVCSFNFSSAYGEIGENYIQVHHLEQLSVTPGKRVIELERDLRPVCANCHQMLYKKTPPYSIGQLKNIIKDKKYTDTSDE